MRKKVLLSISVAALIFVVVAHNVWWVTPLRPEIAVGSKNFAEQYIMGELMKQLLEDRGFTVILKSGRTSSYLREAMECADIDVYAEYTGTAWMVHLGHKYSPGMDNNEVRQLVSEEDEANDITWLDPIWNNNTYALASWLEFVEEYDLETLSDLAALYRERAGEVRTCVGLEFSTRPDGLPALEEHYDFKVAQSHMTVIPVAIPQDNLESNEVDVAMVFGTDAEIAEHGWHVYADDKAFFPPYDLTPCVRKGILDRYPEIGDILNELVGSFPGGRGPASPEVVAECQNVWQELNAKVNIDGMEPDEVAYDYLVEHALIKG